MCGSIRIAETVEEAVQFAIAYGKAWERVAQTWSNDPEPDLVKRREEAHFFIEYHAPRQLRTAANEALDELPDDKLVTNLDYYADVIE